MVISLSNYRLTNFNSWQIISPVDVAGYVAVVDQLLTVQHKSYDKPTILVVRSVKGEEEIPDGAVAVLTPDMPDVLSHVSVRARNSKVFSLNKTLQILKNLCVTLVYHVCWIIIDFPFL